MRMMMTILFLGLAALPVHAEGFSQISDKNDFVSVVDGRKLTRIGIHLDVTPDGKIIGRAFGRDVTGAWTWKSGFFCRDLYWGSRDLGANCQAVRISGDTIRFISDQGSGDFADLKLR